MLPNIRVQAQETTSVSVKDQIEKVLQGKPIVAVMPNSGNHGYCIVILSNESIDHFANNLMKAHINTMTGLIYGESCLAMCTCSSCLLTFLYKW